MAERIAKKYEFLTTPLMPLLPQQALAYVVKGRVSDLLAEGID
jgi:hypothetical protein